MARLVWDASGERRYELGVDRGVLYVGVQAGVPWNGLVSVQEKPSGGDPKPYYLDGVKYLNLSSAEEFEAKISAFSSPIAFRPCDGVSSISNGLYVAQQPRKPFGLTYRTLLGNDTVGDILGYKIHLVYGALAQPSEMSHISQGGQSNPTVFSWDVSTTPELLSGYRPSSHFVIDSTLTDPTLLASFEDILYGSDSAEAALPASSDLLTMFTS